MVFPKIEAVSMDKPENWPSNYRESRIQIIFDHLEVFYENPNYKNREILISLISQGDLNESNSTGLFRITEYEVMLMNSLHLFATNMCLNSLKLYLYKRIMELSSSYKMQRFMPYSKDLSVEIDVFRGLEPSMRMFYNIYANFNIDKNRTFAEQVVFELNDLEQHISTEEEFLYISHSLTRLLNDLGSFHSSQIFSILKWSRTELKDIFMLEAKYLELSNQDPSKRPLKGVLFTTLSSWILKSRNGYNSDYIYKCLPDFAANNSFKEHEVWMREKSKLNDTREGKVINELFNDKTWLKHEWSHNISLKPAKTTYVSSFVKSKPNSSMFDKYGRNLFGYKTDNISDLLAPLFKNETGLKFGQVTHYDITYNTDDIKEEINYLCDIINLFHMSADDKEAFLDTIIQYWLYSIKDPKWEDERERRYEVMIYDFYDYENSRIEDDFLKVRSSLYMFPDFINREMTIYREIKRLRIEKLNAISTKEYIFCSDCLNSDYDSVLRFKNGESKCIQCDSSNIGVKNKRK